MDLTVRIDNLPTTEEEKAILERAVEVASKDKPDYSPLIGVSFWATRKVRFYHREDEQWEGDEVRFFYVRFGDVAAYELLKEVWGDTP